MGHVTRDGGGVVRAAAVVQCSAQTGRSLDLMSSAAGYTSLPFLIDINVTRFYYFIIIFDREFNAEFISDVEISRGNLLLVLVI